MMAEKIAFFLQSTKKNLQTLVLVWLLQFPPIYCVWDLILLIFYINKEN